MSQPDPTIQPTRNKGRARATAGDVPPAIQWHEGMLLAPQHFQQQALRGETLLHYHSAAIAPFHWGVSKLKIDSAKLVTGVVRVEELEAVMPDGLVVSHKAGEGPDLMLDLSARKEELKAEPLTVHLAVAARGRGPALEERFSFVDTDSLADENTGKGEVVLTVMKPKLYLIAGNDPPGKYVTFPLAQVAYRNEAFLETKFEPPWLCVAPGSSLYNLCVAIATRLREKAMFLADQVRAPSLAARVPQLLDTKQLIHCLIGELPAFEAVLRSGVSHPFPLYVALCSLLGHVAGLGRSLVPPLLEPYDHNDLTATFDPVRLAIDRAIDEGVSEAYTSYPFVFHEEDFRLLFDPDWFARSLILGVRMAPGASEADTEAWVKASLIGSRSKIVSLRDLRIPGARRTRIESDTDLVPSRGVTLYSFQADAEHVLPDEELVITNPDDRRRRPQEIVLYVRNRT
ncbi:MAG TPA: type VI secretion system baseplate subunit TssK [Thermoanaerobaculia bacterium]